MSKNLERCGESCQCESWFNLLYREVGMDEQKAQECVEWLRKNSGLDLSPGNLNEEFVNEVAQWVDRNIGTQPNHREQLPIFTGRVRQILLFGQ
jgi:hypothetical protein